MTTAELYHHGILGMKWGRRRYQPYPKDYNGDGKYVGKETKPLSDSEKKELINSGKSKVIERNKDQLTNQELRQALERVDLEKKLKRYNSHEIDNAIDYVDKRILNVKKINGWLSTGLLTYTLIDRISKIKI